MAENVDYFIPPEFGQAAVLPDELPALPANACDAFIRAYVPDGGLVWDPFCRSSVVARAAMRQNKNALLSDFNPLLAFSVRASLNAVMPRQFDRALTTLCDAPTMHTTLRAYVESLYAATCARCGAAASALSYTWDNDLGRPTGKEVYCRVCDQKQPAAAGDSDWAILSKIEERGRAYWTLLERLGASEGALRPLGERLLDLYTARSVYVLSMIQGTLDVCVSDGAAQEVLMLALLNTLRRCMKRYDDAPGLRVRSGPNRPPAGTRSTGARPLTFVEPNCWAVFTEACSEQRSRLEQENAAGPYHRSGLSARPGGARSSAESAPARVRQASPHRMAAELASGSVDLIITAPPSLEWGDLLPILYLWTGWLLGKDDARRFAPDYLLHPKRGADWSFVFTAMKRSLAAAAGALAPAGKLILCVPLAGLQQVNVLALSAAASGLLLENAAFQPYSVEGLRRPQALGVVPGYCYLRFAHMQAAATLPDSTDGLLEAARREAAAASFSLLAERAEATAYIWLHLAALQRLSKTGILWRLASLSAEDIPSWDRLRLIAGAVGQNQGGKLAFIPWTTAAEPSPPDEEAEAETLPALARQRGWWWLSHPSTNNSPLSDRVEWAVYTVLSTTALSSSQAISRVVYALYPGHSTPLPGLIEECMKSYATPAPPIHWQLRPEDALARRTDGHTEMIMLLANLGHQLGLKVWIGQAERRNRLYGPLLTDLLTIAERYMNVEDILPGAAEQSQMVDVIWYQSRRASHVFEVEWTAMLGDAVLRRGTRGGGLWRYLVVPGARAGLLEAKLELLPHLRQRLSEDGWQFVRYEALRERIAGGMASPDELERIVGLHEEAAAEGVQLALW